MSGAAPDVWFAAIPTPSNRGIGPIFRSQIEALLTTNLYTLGTDVQRRGHFVAEFRSLMATAVKYSSDPSLDFVFLHISSPHLPGICGSILPAGCPASEYLGNLLVADKVAGDLRNSLESAGLSETTAVIVSADHPFRHSRDIDGKSDIRVPFLVHVPGQRSQLIHERPLNTIVTRDLVFGLLGGELQSSQQVVEWLTNRRGGLSRGSLATHRDH